ncbi:MAG: hypothetical protein LT103_12060 [Burkholderiaceae bacterium]|nr:hypothetical protein [Burkholderiaceae bacterium]
MQKFKDFRKSGTFRLASDVEVAGELSLAGGATTLDLYSGMFFQTLECRDIQGTAYSGERDRRIRRT